jgi:hypothetical protein
MAMQMELNKKFERYMGATVEAFQIEDVRSHGGPPGGACGKRVVMGASI